MKELMTEKNSLNDKISNLDVIYKILISFIIFYQKRIVELTSKDGSDDEKKRRIRRSAKNIERNYKCPV